MIGQTGGGTGLQAGIVLLVVGVAGALLMTAISGGPPVRAGSQAGPDAQAATTYEVTFYTSTYNANFPFNVHVANVDADSPPEVVIVGVLTDYSLIPTPNPRCSWCNQWRLNAYSWTGTSLTPEMTGTLDVGYEVWVRSDIGQIGSATKIAGAGYMYPCGTGEMHAGLARFSASLQKEQHDWGNRRSDPCHHDMSGF